MVTFTHRYHEHRSIHPDQLGSRLCFFVSLSFSELKQTVFITEAVLFRLDSRVILLSLRPLSETVIKWPREIPRARSAPSGSRAFLSRQARYTDERRTSRSLLLGKSARSRSRRAHIQGYRHLLLLEVDESLCTTRVPVTEPRRFGKEKGLRLIWPTKTVFF